MTTGPRGQADNQSTNQQDGENRGGETPHNHQQTEIRIFSRKNSWSGTEGSSVYRGRDKKGRPEVRQVGTRKSVHRLVLEGQA